MKFFKKQINTATGTISDRIGAYMEHRQRKLAEWMNRKTAYLSRQDLFFGLVVFCSLFGGYLLWLLLNTFGIFN